MTQHSTIAIGTQSGEPAELLMYVSHSTIFFAIDHSLLLCVGTLPDTFKKLLALINGSLGAAGWLIEMTIGVVMAEIIVIVLAMINVQGTVKLVFGIIVSCVRTTILM